MVRDSGAISMASDAEGRLRQTVITAPAATTRNQLYDGVDMVADYDGADVLMRRYVHGPGVDEPLVVYEGAGTGTKNWQYADHRLQRVSGRIRRDSSWS